MAIIDSPFEWEGSPLPTVGELLDAACKAERDGKATEFLTAYRAHTEHADSNLGYIIGYLEPAERPPANVRGLRDRPPGVRRCGMTAADLRAEADRRVTDAVAEAMEQRANGWTGPEIAVVMVDAAHIVADLRQQADAADLAELQLHHLTHGRIVDDISARAELDQADRDLAELYAHHGLGVAL